MWYKFLPLTLLALVSYCGVKEENSFSEVQKRGSADFKAKFDKEFAKKTDIKFLKKFLNLKENSFPSALFCEDMKNKTYLRLNLSKGEEPVPYRLVTSTYSDKYKTLLSQNIKNLKNDEIKFQSDRLVMSDVGRSDGNRIFVFKYSPRFKKVLFKRIFKGFDSAAEDIEGFGTCTRK